MYPHSHSHYVFHKFQLVATGSAYSIGSELPLQYFLKFRVEKRNHGGLWQWHWQIWSTTVLRHSCDVMWNLKFAYKEDILARSQVPCDMYRYRRINISLRRV